MIFYQHYMGDYATDTRDLTPLEHGCYRLLMDHNYATEKPVPNDPKELYRIVGAMTPAERKAVDKVAERFFPVNGDGRRHHKRIEAEIAKAKEKGAKAKASAEARWGKNAQPNAEPSESRTHERSDMRTHSDGNASHNQKSEETKASPADAGEVRGDAANVPDCPHEKLIEAYHELLPTCTRVVEWNEARRALMRARWREKAKPNGKHQGYTSVEGGLAYWRRFFAFVAESEFLTGRAEPTPGRKPFIATLEWLIRPKNFAKVVEGTYHT